MNYPLRMMMVMMIDRGDLMRQVCVCLHYSHGLSNTLFSSMPLSPPHHLRNRRMPRFFALSLLTAILSSLRCRAGLPHYYRLDHCDRGDFWAAKPQYGRRVFKPLTTAIIPLQNSDRHPCLFRAYRTYRSGKHLLRSLFRRALGRALFVRHLRC